MRACLRFAFTLLAAALALPIALGPPAAAQPATGDELGEELEQLYERGPAEAEDGEEIEAGESPSDEEGAAEGEGAEEEEPKPSAETPVLPGTEVIKVTADRREKVIQDVPISVVALDRDFIDTTQLTQFSRLQTFIPNLRITQSVDSRSTAIRIRGIGSIGNNAGVDPSVGIFVDGVYQSRNGMAVQDFLDLERVEVLRGPQGTLFGKNTAAGAIQILSQKPNYERDAMIETQFTDRNGYQVRAMANLPIVDEILASRVSMYWVQQDGWDKNVFNGNQVNDDYRWGAKGRFLWDVTDSADFLVTVDYAKTNRNCCDLDIIEWGTIPSLGALGTTFQGLADNSTEFPVLTPPADPFDRILGTNRRTKERVELGGVSGELNVEIGDYGLHWLNAWRRFYTRSQFDGDFSVYDAVLAGTKSDLDQYSSELRISSPAAELYDWLAGVFVYYQDSDTTDFNSLLQEFADASAVPVPIANVGENTHKTYTVAAYGDGTINFADQWSFTGGLRLTWERKTRKGTQTSTFPGLDVPPLLGPNVKKDEDRDRFAPSGRAIVRYYPAEDVMTYASFASGFKSGGFNQLRTAANVPSEFDDELSLTGELGFRTTWFDNRLTFNMTGYYTYYDDFQAQSFDGASISIRNAGSLQSYGFESDVRVVPADGLVMGLLVGYNIAKYIDFKNGECIVGTVGTPDCPVAGTPPVVIGQDLSGEPLDNAPVWTISTNAQYDLPLELLGVPFVWYARYDYSYTSSFWLAQDLDPVLKQSPTHLLDLRTGVRFNDELWDFQFWVRNVVDESYEVFGIDVPAVSGYAGVNAPARQVGGTVRIRF